ncbi:hypothetical protein D3C71_197280 [compost metagenome]
MLFWKRRPQESRERLAALTDTCIVAVAGMLALAFVMNVGIGVAGMVFPRVFDPVSAIGHGVTTGEILAGIAIFHSMLSASLLAAVGMGLAAMVLMILAWSFRTRGVSSIACSCAVMIALASPAPKAILVAILSVGERPWAVVPGASEALAGAILNSDSWSGGFSSALLVVTAALTWYRIALSVAAVPGLRFMPRSLRPADI